ncbi:MULTISPECIES: cytochrome c biogenesis CcdA family protein [unclassified Cryobacterium]|uniref:cytochrome c biogenesis CcdA family protein n=1 Tax=unclassified Cryobacterium TaxID=2649013 RepID=UPI002AB59437|nr:MULTISPECIES: cytochrome c biogenesis protein CcdA [unclassified Cryobacterium]MDY7543732.1 cytochrome c biogenesis protein CcdA [Cryobacterium sp. 5B3]MEA9997538.1 cytochrome c biogenesis protein CcdA [Cryobacterium sp. RTS3]MEB0264297.1 cytochrome c biogenesis protein CcdA [Cryobacterium sp. 10I5]MEB0273479.1 cytochrome c biogenesis protein CcdA [Cryobacterium sp. 5B3]
MENLLFGGTLLAAFLGGLVALLAPCCVSVMLPAYFASGMRRRSGIVGATLVFAAGVATIIVPIGLGATALIGLISGQHAIVFTIAATAMLIGGIAMLFGWKLQLPMLARRVPAGHGLASVYGLGVFSGAASSCCAPVLIGVAVLSGATASFPAALAVGLTYVTGMVAPLAILALVWDRKDWASSKWLQGRQITLHLGRHRRSLAVGSLGSAVLLIVMAILTYIQAAVGPGMTSGGWLAQFGADLQHSVSVVTKALAWLPGWAVAIVLVASSGYFVWRAARNTEPKPPEPTTTTPDGPVQSTDSESSCCSDAALETPARTGQDTTK